MVYGPPEMPFGSMTWRQCNPHAATTRALEATKKRCATCDGQRVIDADGDGLHEQPCPDCAGGSRLPVTERNLWSESAERAGRL